MHPQVHSRRAKTRRTRSLVAVLVSVALGVAGLLTAAPAQAATTVVSVAPLVANCYYSAIRVSGGGQVTMNAGDSYVSYLRVDGQAATPEFTHNVTATTNTTVSEGPTTPFMDDGATHRVEWVLNNVVYASGTFSYLTSCDNKSAVPITYRSDSATPKIWPKLSNVVLIGTATGFSLAFDWVQPTDAESCPDPQGTRCSYQVSDTVDLGVYSGGLADHPMVDASGRTFGLNGGDFPQQTIDLPHGTATDPSPRSGHYSGSFTFDRTSGLTVMLFGCLPNGDVYCGAAYPIAAGELSATISPVFRFWSPIFQGHFYTIDPAERDRIISTMSDVWTYEGPQYDAFTTQMPGTVPLFRFWSDTLHGHFYTVSATERDTVISTWPDIWSYEGVAYYVYPPDSTVSGSTGVYRFWSPVANHHFYTASADERDHVIATWPDFWTYELEAFRVPQ